jgi:hypothetical protein
VSKVSAVDQNRYHLSIANLAQFRAKFGTSKFFLFVFGRNQKSVEELRNGPVVDFCAPVYDFNNNQVRINRLCACTSMCYDFNN